MSHALDGPALRWIINKDVPNIESQSGWRARLGGLGKTVALRAFTKVTSTPFIEGLLEFISLFGEVLIQLKKRGGSLEDLLKSPSSDLWIVTSPCHAQLNAAQQVTDILRSRGYSVSGWLINRTPLMIHDMVNQISSKGITHPSTFDSQSFNRIYQSGMTELNELLRTQPPSVKEQAIHAWITEVENARYSFKALQEINETQLRIMLIRELVFGLTALERLKSLAESLETQLKEE